MSRSIPQTLTQENSNLVVRVFASSATWKTGKVKKKRTQVVLLESRSLSPNHDRLISDSAHDPRAASTHKPRPDHQTGFSNQCAWFSSVKQRKTKDPQVKSSFDSRGCEKKTVAIYRSWSQRHQQWWREVGAGSKTFRGFSPEEVGGLNFLGKRVFVNINTEVVKGILCVSRAR